ncbi:sulfur carrier protein ThiS adenylyltransferase ThiF [Maridesulfovibrio hydrothermalis]|uniref:Thiamine biosynthesis protein ThiF n=1 Tax=Maridesulfovibrio hydrothermalis AM13 = DSM 14728 TaxID=1121451 RepID=L0RD59_9BACT|nr:sulfur carrier protein ThiS adenylyltransferase ThiF [Maridesulfovibrio hydrothermalis]CCO24135.1 Thiamine biosynthesis protein ThiF [Maridesulfovibrio hydrothermalis AM13 = DSM 14728]
MNLTEQGIASYLGEEKLKYLQTITIGIAGTGGLGSNCAMHLVRSGFRKFVLVDFDRIEESNLNRQFFRQNQIGEYKVEALDKNLKEINPDLDIFIRYETVTPDNMMGIFKNCDVVIEAFDAARIKKALVETFLPTDKLIVTASGMGGAGNADEIVTRKIRENLYIIGDMKTECNEQTPPFSPKVGIAAAKQADVVLAYYLSKFESEGYE